MERAFWSLGGFGLGRLRHTVDGWMHRKLRDTLLVRAHPHRLSRASVEHLLVQTGFLIVLATLVGHNYRMSVVAV